MSEIKEVIRKLRRFRDEGDWEQFHNSKDLAVAISIEASELLELFLWKENEEAEPEKLKEELADVMTFCFLLADKHELDISEIIFKKLEKNKVKYPVEKAKGIATKYTDL